ncbi:MAG: hypothetical protein N2505_06620 [Endomicrobia bacterium]|nr:hypothetical protein [Endomicrobiia bacterium]
MLYDLKGLTKIINDRMNWDVGYCTIFHYYRKGYLKPTTFYIAGKRRYPLFDEKNLDRVVYKLEELNRQGIIRLHKL